MASKLRQAAIDRLVARGPPVPQFVDQFVARHEVAIAHGEGDQNPEYARLRSFFVLTLAQHPTQRQHLPLTEPKTLSKLVLCRHLAPPDTTPRGGCGSIVRHW
jgi:hypothetical protein